MFGNIVEIRKLGEDRLSELNTEITGIEEQVDWRDGNFRNRRQRVYTLGKLYKQRGRMSAFLEVLAEIRGKK